MPRHPDPLIRARLTDAREFRADALCLNRAGRSLQAVPLAQDAALSLLLAVSRADGLEIEGRPTLPDLLARLEGRNSLPALDEIALDRLQGAALATRAVRAWDAADLALRAEVPPNAFTEAMLGLRALEDWAEIAFLRIAEATPVQEVPDIVQDIEPVPEDDPFLF